MRWGHGDKLNRPATHPEYLRKDKKWDDKYDKAFGKKKTKKKEDQNENRETE